MGRPSNLRLAALLFSVLDLSISLVARTIVVTRVICRDVDDLPRYGLLAEFGFNIGKDLALHLFGGGDMDPRKPKGIVKSLPAD